MLHARNRLLSPWILPRFSKPLGFSVATNWRLRHFYSTLNIEKARESVQSADPSQLKALWDQISVQDTPAALSLRAEFYTKLRAYGLKSQDSYWALTILDVIPVRIMRYADYLFITELLMSHKQWHALGELLVDVAGKLPTIWERLFLQLVSTAGNDFPVENNLRILFESCLEMKIDLADISRTQNSPIMDIVQIIISKYDTDSIISSLESIASTNSLQASTLTSCILRAISDLSVGTGAPPTLLELAGEDENKNQIYDLPARLWDLKLRRNSVSSNDLKVFMMFLIYKRRPRHALELYDKMPDLQSHGLNEAVLLAASGAGDLDRLQIEFEKVEQNPKLIEELGGQRYAIVLQALGFVGDAGILNDTFKNLSTWHADLRTRGVYHALIYSNGLRGDITSTLKAYNMMLNAQIEPTASTFSLILKVYRDARDLPGFISFLGNEMIAKYQFPLRNQELSTALSLCGKKRDFKSAEYIWAWANSLLTPDSRSWNSYLNSFVVTNQFPKAWEIFHQMEQSKMVGIDTLAIMMGGTCRYPDTSEYLQKILEKQESLELEPDQAWYSSYLSVLAELGDLSKFEAAFSELKNSGITLNALHYALYTDLLAKTKNLDKHQQLFKEMKNRRVPISFAFIEKYLHLLSAPGSSAESRKSAIDAAFSLVKEGYFDPWSELVPRGAIPARVIKPVVRRLLKSRQYLTARKLLDSLHDQRANEHPIGDDYMLWALYMEVASASKSLVVIETLWTKFVKSLEFVFALEKPGKAAVDEVIDGFNVRRAPEYGVPARYRFNFSRQIDCRIDQLAEDLDSVKLLQLPAELTRLGLSMDNRNMNNYIRALADSGQYEDAFATTIRANELSFFKLSGATATALTKGVGTVKLSNYGHLGEYIRNYKVPESFKG